VLDDNVYAAAVGDFFYFVRDFLLVMVDAMIGTQLASFSNFASSPAVVMTVQ
jgi:hypothetical protein